MDYKEAWDKLREKSRIESINNDRRFSESKSEYMAGVSHTWNDVMFQMIKIEKEIDKGDEK